MFDYVALTEDELEMKKGNIVTIISKVWTCLYMHIVKL